MFSPVAGVSTGPAPKISPKLTEASPLGRSAAVVPVAHRSGIAEAVTGQLNVVMLSRQQEDPFLVVADLLGQALGLERRAGETDVEYLGRISDGLAALSPSDRARLQTLLSKALSALQLGKLLAAIRNPSGPERATFAFDLEASMQKGGTSAVVSSYRMTELEQSGLPAKVQALTAAAVQENGGPLRSLPEQQGTRQASALSASSGPSAPTGPSVLSVPVGKGSGTTQSPAATPQLPALLSAGEAAAEGVNLPAPEPRASGIAARQVDGQPTLPPSRTANETAPVAATLRQAETSPAGGRVTGRSQLAAQAQTTPNPADQFSDDMLDARHPMSPTRDGGRAVSSWEDGRKREQLASFGPTVPVALQAPAQGTTEILDKADLLRALLRLGFPQEDVPMAGRSASPDPTMNGPAQYARLAETAEGRLQPNTSLHPDQRSPADAIERSRLAPPPLALDTDEFKLPIQLQREGIPFAIVQYLFDDPAEVNRPARQDEDDDDDEAAQDEQGDGEPADEGDGEDQADRNAAQDEPDVPTESLVSGAEHDSQSGREAVQLSHHPAFPVTAALPAPDNINVAQGLYLRLSDGI